MWGNRICGGYLTIIITQKVKNTTKGVITLTKNEEFEQLCVKYGTGYSIETTLVDGLKRNGNIRYKTIYRAGMQTDLGDIELSDWKARANALIAKYDENGILQRLIKEATFPFMNKEEAENYALELHMSRIFENPEWVGYERWHGSAGTI